MQAIRFAASRFHARMLCVLMAISATMAVNAQTVQNNGTGTHNGYYYSLYTSSGSATMTFPGLVWSADNQRD